MRIGIRSKGAALTTQVYLVDDEGEEVSLENLLIERVEWMCDAKEDRCAILLVVPELEVDVVQEFDGTAEDLSAAIDRAREEVAEGDTCTP